MDEQTIKKLILEILQEKMAPDLLLLSKGNEESSQETKVFLETSRELGLSLGRARFGEGFLEPKRALYLEGFGLEEGLKLLASEEDPYTYLREMGKKIPIFLEVQDPLPGLEGEKKASFLKSLTDLLQDRGIRLLVSGGNRKKALEDRDQESKSVGDLRGKKILTLRDLDRENIEEIIVDENARLTMALSDWLRDHRILVRRMKCN